MNKFMYARPRRRLMSCVLSESNATSLSCALVFRPFDMLSMHNCHQIARRHRSLFLWLYG